MTEQEKIRREKLEELKKHGINPYPAELFPVDNLSIDLIENYKENSNVIIAGRIMSRRIQGMPLLLRFKIVKVEFKFTSTEMRFVVVMIRQSIIPFIKSCWI